MLSWPTLHAILNHFPIVLIVVGAIVLLVAVIRPMRGAWLYALGSFIFAGVSVYPAWITGESAARFVHGAWYIAPGAVHRHAELADITLWIVLALGLVSLIAWLSIARTTNAFSPAGWLRTLVALLAIAALGSIGATAYFGGKIVIESPILMKDVPPLPPPVPCSGAAQATGQPVLPCATGPAPAPAAGSVPGAAPGGAITQPNSAQPNQAQPYTAQPNTAQPAQHSQTTPATP